MALLQKENCPDPIWKPVILAGALRVDAPVLVLAQRAGARGVARGADRAGQEVEGALAVDLEEGRPNLEADGRRAYYHYH